MKSLVVLTLIAASQAKAAGGNVLFEETFDHYGVQAPGLHESSRTREWPPSLKFMAFSPTEESRLFDDSARVNEDEPGWRNYELRFSFRFFGDSQKRFDVELPVRSEGLSDRNITFSIGYADNYQLIAPGAKTSPEESTALATPLLINQWYDGWIRVQDGELTAWLDNGTAVKLGSIRMPGLLTLGFNIRTDTSVMFDYFRVTELPAHATDFGASQDPCLRASIPPLASRQTQVKTAVAQESHALEIPADANRASASVRVGDAGKQLIRLVWANDTTTVIHVTVGAQDGHKPIMLDGKQTRETVALPDAFLRFTGGLTRTRHVRPDITRYEQLDLLRMIEAWPSLPAASQHFLNFEVRLDTVGAEVWIDGRFAGRIDSDARLKTLAFDLEAGGAIHNEFVGTVEYDPEFLVLNSAAIAVPGVMTTAKLSLEPGAREVNGIPFEVVEGSRSVDVGIVQEHRGSWALECDLYLSRTAFSGVPDTLRLSVPVAQYNRAYVLCAIEPDPQKIPVLTARLTHFKPESLVGMGPAIATTSITFPHDGEEASPGISTVGSVQYEVDGQTHNVPLYLAEIPLDVGSIQDLLFQGENKTPYLDIDLIGKPRQSTQQWKLSDKPDPLTRSAVHVFGLTLARSPVEMVIMPAQVGNAYYPDENPKMSVSLRAFQPGAYLLRCAISDVSGTQLEVQKRQLTFAAAGETQTVDLSFSQDQVGWYQADFTLNDQAGKGLLRHTASFVRQPADTRRAGYESPYYSWWYGGAGGTTKDIDVIGPLLKRSGIRRTNLKDEQQGALYGLTKPYLSSMHRLYEKDDPQGSARKMVEAITAERQKFPHVDHALIFHENLSGPFPMELLDKTPAPTAQQVAYGKEKSEVAQFVAKVYREHFPDVKLVIGNSGNSVGGLAYLFREGYPAELIDFMGEESAGQTIPPEKNESIGGTAYSFWMLRQLALKFGYQELSVAACHERNYRSYRVLGPVKAAAFTVRDALIVHAWNSPVVPIMGPEDVAYSYGNSVWGDFGMFSRTPQTYPRPGFAAMSTLTRVLDRATFSRQMATGSLTAYAFEFARDAQLIYPLWTARGTRELTLTFAGDTAVTVTDFWGHETQQRTTARALRVTAGTEPLYVTATVKVDTIAAGRSTFPEDAIPDGATVTVANSMSRADEWELVDTVDPRIDNPGKHGDYPPFRQPGAYRLRQVADDELGDCLELELVPQGTIPTIMNEYTFLRLKTPVPVPGKPTTLGVWVKGNSGWGQIMWEFQDAEGEKWLSCGTGGYGCNVYDWPGQASINFDGWNFVQFPITQDSPIRVESPGGVRNEWQRDGTGNGRIDYPIKLTGMAISMQRQSLDLLEMKPVETVVRFKDLSTY